MQGRRTILMVEDEESITVPLSEALARDGFDTQVAGSVAEALELAGSIAPDVVLLDVMLPDGTGSTSAARRRGVPGRSSCSPPAARRLTDGGAQVSAPTTISSSRSAPRGAGADPRRAPSRGRESALAPAREGPLAVGELKLDTARRSATLAGKELDLTRKEFELLELLMREAGSVITRERLIDEVWDVNWFGSTKTLDVHVSGLRRKLGDDSASPRFIHTVRGVGFRFSGPEELESGLGR